ncbi:MAG: 2-amino-4-hydroxy-6-hydroxymethyldihydropteridine diphosphokinase, partial [Pseudomonadales bacterium]
MRTTAPHTLAQTAAAKRRNSVRCYIGLGSNLSQPLLQLRRALIALDDLPRSRLQNCSSVYRSEPLGPGVQPDYLNAVAELHTALAPLPLLAALKAIERRAGRVHTRRWAPRALDLDILLYGECRLQTRQLELPHPQLWQRNFVLYPLYEIAPGLRFPDGRQLDAAALQHLPGRLKKQA